MSKQVINGYIIVNPKTVTSSYRGVDREPWGGIGDAFYAGRLPEQLRQVWDAMRPRDLWWATCRREMLEKFESFLNQEGIPYEVLAVCSSYLSAARSERTALTPEHLFLGFDVVGVGQWSLLRALLESPAHRSVADLVNDAGLLADLERGEFIAATYADATGRNEVEPLGETDPRLPIDVVSVYQLVRQ